MSLIEFENKRWRESPQKIVFRHKAALEFISGGKVLDLGCGDGLFMSMLKEKGVDCVGVDISPQAVNSCLEKGLNARLCNIESDDLPFDDDEFDVVVLLDNLEHLFYPDALIKKAKRVGRQIVISVPNFNSFPARIQVLLGGVPENNRPNKGHVYWFNYNVLKNILKDSNLKIVSLQINVFWGDRRFIGSIIKFLGRFFPNFFALSLVLMVDNERS